MITEKQVEEVLQWMLDNEDEMAVVICLYLQEKQKH